MQGRIRMTGTKDRKWIATCLTTLLVGVWLLSGCASGRKVVADIPIDTLDYDTQRKFDYLFLEATRQRQNGELVDALSLYEQCLEINPHSAATMYELAQFYAFLNQVERSGELLQRAVETEPDNFWYKQTLGTWYYNAKQPEKAIAVYEEIVEQFPSKVEMLMQLMALYNQQHDYKNVLKCLNRLEVKEGKSEMLSMEKYRVCIQLGDKEQAYKELQSLIEEYPNDMRYRLTMAQTYVADSRYEEARQIFDYVLNQEPDNALAQLGVIAYHHHLGNDSLASLLQDSLLMNPKFDSKQRTEYMRQVILEREQQGKDSLYVLNLFERVLSLPQEDANVAMLCYSYMKHHNMDDEQTRPVLERILSIEPDNVAARYNLLMTAVRKNDYAEAVRICEPAIQYNPEELHFYYYLAVSYFQVKDTDASLATLEKGAALVDKETDKNLASDLYALLGDLRHSKGEAEKAFAAYDSALVYNPNNIGTLNNYAYYLSLERRDLDKAEEMSYRTVKAEPTNDTYLDTYAWILFEKGRYAEARIYIEEAMKNGGEASATIVEHCGDIYYMLGEKDEALRYWRQAEGMENDSKTLKQKIKQQKYIGGQ